MVHFKKLDQILNEVENKFTTINGRRVPYDKKNIAKKANEYYKTLESDDEKETFLSFLEVGLEKYTIYQIIKSHQELLNASWPHELAG